MDAISNALITLLNIAIVVVGFGLIVFVHELGHFVAAKWARIRVLAFALGFGPAVFSYRKGMGFRRGSSEREYLDIIRAEPGRFDAFSPTEYRLNALPLGGYVKMLGQEDLNPGAVSSAPDSYQNCHPAKRLVVISAGVVMNVLLAGVLFIAVFLIGLERQPALIGTLTPGGPAASAVAVNAADLADASGAALSEDDLRPRAGDRVVSIDGRRPSTFDDLILAGAMGERGRAVRFTLEREGVSGPLEFAIVPTPGVFDGLLDFGIEPYRSNRLLEAGGGVPDQDVIEGLARVGLAGVEPGSVLVRAGDRPVASAHDLRAIVGASGGAPVPLVFEAPDGTTTRIEMRPVAQLENGLVPGTGDAVVPIEHLLGLTPVMMVEDVNDRGRGQGLRTGDVFERIGSVEFPSMEQGIRAIRAAAGGEIDVVVRRAATGGDGPEGAMEPDEDLARDAFTRVTLRCSVTREGTIGFIPDTVAEFDTLVSLPPERVRAVRRDAEAIPPPADGVIEHPGTRIEAVDGTPVATFTELRGALAGATRAAHDAGTGATVRMTVQRLLANGETPRETVEWTLSADDVARLHALSWETPFPIGLFDLESFTLRADGPWDAVKTGVGETHRVMMSTYLTLLRLFQGTVRVEHLKGPVGITHMGTIIADRGPIWLMFFFALVSVNLAVINFLPLPIVDGGQFLMIVYEWVRGKPVPVGLQNAMTLAGLLLIGSVFVIVTFNDVARLLGG
ncbi:MAG: site-2 protease family protein [Phycisphaeraceae bacterium]|nr:site-2 protease family protein [Phycisphaeraceae bacterium]